MIAVYNPNNQLDMMSSEVMDRVIEIVQKEIFVVSDEVYRGAELNGIECRSLQDPQKKQL